MQHAVDIALWAGEAESSDERAQRAETERANAIAEAGGNPFPHMPDLERWRR